MCTDFITNVIGVGAGLSLFLSLVLLLALPRLPRGSTDSQPGTRIHIKPAKSGPKKR